MMNGAMLQQVFVSLLGDEWSHATAGVCIILLGDEWSHITAGVCIIVR